MDSSPIKQLSSVRRMHPSIPLCLANDMSAITLEILKITVGAGFQLTSPAFAQLRQTAFSAGVKDQWCGMIQDRPNLLCWLIGTLPSFLAV